MYSKQFCKDVTFVLGDRNFILDSRRGFLIIKTCGSVEFQLNASILNGNRTKLLPSYWKRIKSAILRRHSSLYCQFPTANRGHHFFGKHAIDWQNFFQSSRPSFKRHPWEWLCSICVSFEIVSDAPAFHTNVAIFWYSWEALYHKCCINFRAWIYHITHSLDLSLRTFRAVNTLVCLIILSLFFLPFFIFFTRYFFCSVCSRYRTSSFYFFLLHFSHIRF